MSPPEQHEWSLATRLSRWILVLTIVPVLLALLAGYIFLEATVSRELVALVEEELEETELCLRQGGTGQNGFAKIASELAAQHPSVRLAWRVFDLQGKVLGEYGDPDILTSDWPGPACVQQVRDLGEGLLTKSMVAPDGTIVGLILDGSGLVTVVTRYGMVGIGVALFAAALAFVASRLLVRKVTVLLDRVTESAGAPKGGLEGAPTEIRQVAESLHQVLRAVRKESEEARIFTMSLAHELRSPVQNLIGQAEVALLKTRDPQAYETLLTSQLEELNELADALDNLLAIFSTPAATNGYAPATNDSAEQFDLGAEAQLRMAREQQRATREDVVLTVNTHGNTEMAGNREAVLRGLRNVVANALNWSPRGSDVQVDIDGADEDIVVTVDDAGPGVPAPIRARVFSPFFQGPQRQAGRIGYGLGLAMAKKAVTAQGGTIQIGTSPAGGARFTITMPRQRWQTRQAQ
jgi:signal transduction histidine kinase